MKIEITKSQLNAIIHLRDDIDAMIGCAYNEDGENADNIWRRKIRIIDRFLKANSININDYR